MKNFSSNVGFITLFKYIYKWSSHLQNLNLKNNCSDINEVIVKYFICRLIIVDIFSNKKIRDKNLNVDKHLKMLPLNNMKISDYC